MPGPAALAIALLAAWPSVGRPSGDYRCPPRFSLTFRTFDRCNNVPFLSPGNDSRVNLLLVLADAGTIELGVRPSPGYAPVPFSLDDLSESDATGRDVTKTNADGKTLAELASEAGLRPEQVPASSSKPFADGDANRCRSNGDVAAQAFLVQLVASAEIPEDERRELARSRLAATGSCGWDDAAVERISPANVQTPLGREFAGYVRGAIAFYNGAFDEARRDFEALHESIQPWLREAAQYMIGRTELNRAQQNAFDAYGWPDLDRVDHGALEAADAAFRAYLRDHPTGAYAASATGLLRRVYWLMNDRRRLAREYVALLANPDAPRNVSWPAIAREIDAKLLGPDAGDVDEPWLVAVMDLMLMRMGMGMRIPDLRARLDAQRPLFAQQPRLYDYLRSAFRFYVEGDAAGALRSLPKAAPGPLDYVGFSQESLRGLALEATGDRAAARALWRALLPRAPRPLMREQLELALALNYERSGRLAGVFARDSPIVTPELRRVLLQRVAGPALLRRQIAAPGTPDERDAALFALLYKDLTRGRYDDLVTDLKLLPKDVPPPEPNGFYGYAQRYPPAMFGWGGGRTEDGYTCPSLRDVGRTLQKNPKSPVGLNCLGEFILLYRLDDLPLEGSLPEDLGGTRSQFPGRVYSRLDGYRHVMNDRTARRDDRAYALYRAIHCFYPTGRNGCGAQTIALKQRREWFRTLKFRYADTTWGRNLKYYW